MAPTSIDETQRTTALAFWRYAHDYVRVARTLCEQHKLRASESQAVFHLAAQGLEFALKAFLRAKGVPAAQLCTEVGHSIADALARSRKLGLSLSPSACNAIDAIARHHRPDAFVFVDDTTGAFADVSRYVAAGIQILDRIVPDVVADYIDHHAAAASPPAFEFVARLRADLLATADGIPQAA